MRKFLATLLLLVNFFISFDQAQAYTQQAVTAPLGPFYKVHFWGDSITAGGATSGGWIALVQQFADYYHPDYHLSFMGHGVPGNTSTDLLNRFYAEVNAYKPDVAVIFIGVNDIGFSGGNVNWTTYYDNLAQMIIWANQAGVKQVVLMCPLCIGERRQGMNPYDVQLNYMTQIISQVSQAYQVPVIDTHDFWIGAESVYNQGNYPSGILTQEQPPQWGVHPQYGTGMGLLGGCVIKAFGM